MNKNAIKCLLSSIAFVLLSSCSITFKISGNTNSSISSIDTSVSRKLYIISYPSIVSYYQYDHLDFTDLEVEERTYKNDELVSSVLTTDYSLRWKADHADVDTSSRLSEIGDFTIEVYKTNFEPASFDISVLKPSTFRQSVSVLEKGKTQYYLNENFDPSGFELEVKTVKTSATKETRFSEVFDYTHCTFTYNSKEIDSSFTFDSKKDYEIDVSLDSIESFSYTLNIQVFNPTLSIDEIADDTMALEEEDKELTLTVSNSEKTTEEGDKGYYSPDEVKLSMTNNEFAKNNIYDWRYTPTTGKIPLLVIPVVLQGDSSRATDSYWNLINKAFYGKSDDLNFESLHSYYYKSSFGKLDFTGCMTDYFYPDNYDSTLSTYSYLMSEDKVSKIAKAAWEWAKDTYDLRPSDYDTDKDGCVDAMWLVYMHPSNSSTTAFWGYTSTTQETNDDPNDPVVNNYGWVSYDFINDGFVGGSSYDNASCDAHVLIHETGHMLGATDYYSYSYNSYAPLGKVDMMDNNVGDHNGYTKLTYGWTKPYIVYGDCTLTINAGQYENNVIVISYDSKTYETDEDGKVLFNPFDEYILIELYSDKNLNSQGYDAYGVDNITTIGAKIYHVDSRLGNYNLTTGAVSLFSSPDAAASKASGVIRFITNSESGERAESNYGSNFNDYWDEIRLISADKVKISSNNTASSSALFKKGKTFSLSSYSAQFVNGKFDNNQDFNYSVKVNSIE